MTREECINNLKQSKGTPHKHQTVTKAIADLRKLDKIEQIVNEEMRIMESDLLWKIKEVLKQE